jgi:hypothetical protein
MNQNERINDELLLIQAQEGAFEAIEQLIERWQDRLSIPSLAATTPNCSSAALS